MADWGGGSGTEQGLGHHRHSHFGWHRRFVYPDQSERDFGSPEAATEVGGAVTEAEAGVAGKAAIAANELVVGVGAGGVACRGTGRSGRDQQTRRLEIHHRQ